MLTGEQNDPNGLEYLRARYYDSATGRFLSRDPLGGGYPYAGGNPANMLDPTGLAAEAGGCTYYNTAIGEWRPCAEQDFATSLNAELGGVLGSASELHALIAVFAGTVEFEGRYIRKGDPHEEYEGSVSVIIIQAGSIGIVGVRTQLTDNIAVSLTIEFNKGSEFRIGALQFFYLHPSIGPAGQHYPMAVSMYPVQPGQYPVSAKVTILPYPLTGNLLEVTGILGSIGFSIQQIFAYP